MINTNQVKVNEIIKLVAREQGLNIVDVERAVSNIFDATSEIMEESGTNVIYLRYFGTFGGKLSRIKSIERAIQRKIDKDLKNGKEDI